MHVPLCVKAHKMTCDPRARKPTPSSSSAFSVPPATIFARPPIDPPRADRNADPPPRPFNPGVAEAEGETLPGHRDAWLAGREEAGGWEGRENVKTIGPPPGIPIGPTRITHRFSFCDIHAQAKQLIFGVGAKSRPPPHPLVPTAGYGHSREDTLRAALTSSRPLPEAPPLSPRRLSFPTLLPLARREASPRSSHPKRTEPRGSFHSPSVSPPTFSVFSFRRRGFRSRTPKQVTSRPRPSRRALVHR